VERNNRNFQNRADLEEVFLGFMGFFCFGERVLEMGGIVEY
jgi:hypothetical protein